MSGHMSGKWQVECKDHGSLVFLGKPEEQKYKANQEMWKHRHAGHETAKVIEC